MAHNDTKRRGRGVLRIEAARPLLTELATGALNSITIEFEGQRYGVIIVPELKCTPGGASEDPAEERVSVPASQPEAPGGAVRELLPCPFCGTVASVRKVDSVYGVFIAECTHRWCAAAVYGHNESDAATRWNRRAHGAGAGEAETREGSEGGPSTSATSPVPAPPASHARSFARHLVQVCSNFDGVLDPRKVEEEVSGLIVRLDSSADYGEEMRGKLYAARDALEKAEAELAELRAYVRVSFGKEATSAALFCTAYETLRKIARGEE